MEDKYPTCNFNFRDHLVSTEKSIVTGLDGAIPEGRAAADPCLHQNIQYQIQRSAVIDPYIQHMPRHDVREATLYASRMGEKVMI